MKELLKKYALPVGLGLVTAAVGVFVVRRNSVEEEGAEALVVTETIEPVVQGKPASRTQKVEKN